MKLLLLQLMILICPTLYAQKVEGVGPFRVGKTTTTVIDSLKKKKYTYNENPDWISMVKQKSARSITLLITEATGFIRNSKTKTTKDFKVYNIGAIDSKVPTAYNLILSFYKDTLCSIISNYYQPDFTQFIKKQLGLPKDSVHTTIINCATFKNLVIADTISTYTGRTDLRIFEARGFYYDRQCSKKQKYFFEISNPVIMRMLSKSSNSFDLIFPYFFQ